MEDLRQIYDVACIIAGGEETCAEKPFFLVYLEPISPLIMDRPGVDRLLFCAERGCPILYAAGANCGTGAPITPEGGVVQGGAESLAGLVLAALKNEKIPFVYGANTSAMDMKSMIVCYGDPTWFRTVAMYADMGRFYGLPSWGTAGSSDSFDVDAQAAMEAYEGISLAFMAGTTLAHDVGYLAHGEIYDARMLVLTDMIIGRVRHLMKPADLSEDALAVKVIDEVARSGELYLTHPHTLNKYRESLWLPPEYFNRKHIAQLEIEPLPDLMKEEVQNILSDHEPRPLSGDKLEQIDRYLDSQ
jgi:trimethylamine--corrinoid protein Co-methyltransferase